MAETKQDAHQYKMTISISIRPQLVEQLDQLALEQERSRSYLVEKAVERYLEENPPALPEQE